MIAATYNCGCPVPKQSLITEPVGLQAPCSPCCFRPRDALCYSRGQTTQCYIQSARIEKSKCIYPIVKDRISDCIDPPRMHSTFVRRPISAATSCASKESTNKQSLRSKSESKLKEHEIPNMEQAPTEKVVSEIVRKGQPYKEIEAVINDNRVIIRMHKESVKEEYNPPCECVDQKIAEESTSSLKKCEDDVVFDMADGNLKLCRAPREDASLTKKTCDQEETGCRTVTLYPNIKDGDGTEGNTTVSCREIEEIKKLKMKRPIELEENPNIFLLRIRKHRDSGDKRQKIDLEFRAPRPWRRKDGEKEPRANLIEKLDKHEEKADEEKHVDKKDDDWDEEIEDWDKENWDT